MHMVYIIYENSSFQIMNQLEYQIIQFLSDYCIIYDKGISHYGETSINKIGCLLNYNVDIEPSNDLECCCCAIYYQNEGNYEKMIKYYDIILENKIYKGLVGLALYYKN